MIKIEEIEVWGFEHAIRGMRNPMNSWDKSDSITQYDDSGNHPLYVELGENDLALMHKLYKASETGNYAHRKFLRQIFVSMDITAPLYWWKEFDTYKVGTVANSCSTMHKIHEKEFELNDFSHEHLVYEFDDGDGDYDKATWGEVSLLKTIEQLNRARNLYLDTKDKKYWWIMIQLLPTSFNQKRTVTMNYENVVNIIKQRTGHKLDEWNIFCDTMLTNLPYLKEIIEYDKTN
jgi:hypothetical protein